MINKCPAFYVSRMFTAVYTKTCQRSLSQTTHQAVSLKVHFNIILPSTPMSSEWSLPFRLYNQNSVSICHIPLRVACQTGTYYLQLEIFAHSPPYNKIISVNMSSILYLKTTECRHACIHILVSVAADSSPIVLGYRVGVRFPAEAADISPSCRIQAGTGTHPLCQMGTVGSFLGIKRVGHEANHSLQSSNDVKKLWVYTSTSSKPVRNINRDNFTFIVTLYIWTYQNLLDILYSQN
jgi:hypothetical protein